MVRPFRAYTPQCQDGAVRLVQSCATLRRIHSTVNQTPKMATPRVVEVTLEGCTAGVGLGLSAENIITTLKPNTPASLPAKAYKSVHKS